MRRAPVPYKLFVRDGVLARDKQNAKTPDDYTEGKKDDGYEVAAFHPNTPLTSTRLSAGSNQTLARQSFLFSEVVVIRRSWGYPFRGSPAELCAPVAQRIE